MRVVRIILSLVIILLLAVAVVYALSSQRINKTYDIQLPSLLVPSDAEAILRGEHIATVRGCMDCHGAQGEGKLFIDAAPMFARIVATNLTSGKGGIGADYSNDDWLRSIRHGVGKDSKSHYFMPSEEFGVMTEQDLGDLIAYLKNLAPVDSDLPKESVGPIARMLLLAGQFPLLPAEVIDHSAAIPTVTPTGVTLEHGAYLAITCSGCHGQSFSGGALPGSSADDPVPTNLTPDVATGLGAWSEADFAKAMREGVRPDDSQLDPFMPWQTITSAFTDDELAAVWLYLQSVPALAQGNR